MFETTEALTMAAYGGGTGVGIAFGLQFMKWLLTFFAGRLDAKEAHLDAALKDLVDGMRSDLDRMKVEAAADRQEIADVRNELRHCERKHLDSEAKVARLEAMMQGYGDFKQIQAIENAAEHLTAKTNSAG